MEDTTIKAASFNWQSFMSLIDGLQFCHDNCYMLSDFVPDNSFTFHAKALDNVPHDTV